MSSNNYEEELGDWLDGFDSEYVDRVLGGNDDNIITILINDGDDTFCMWDE